MTPTLKQIQDWVYARIPASADLDGSTRWFNANDVAKFIQDYIREHPASKPKHRRADTGIHYT